MTGERVCLLGQRLWRELIILFNLKLNICLTVPVNARANYRHKLNRMKTFTNCVLKLLCLLVIIAWVFMPKNASAQKKALVYLGNPVAYINLMLPSADSLLLVDGTGALYSNRFSAAVDGNDAGKLPNFNENICLFRDGQKLAIETRPIPKQQDTLFVRMWGMYNQTYSLQIYFRSIFAMFPVHALLIDNYLHTQKQIDLFGKTLYSFTPDVADTNSYINRFQIVFSRNNTVQNNDVVSINTAQQLNAGAGKVSVYPNPLTGHLLTLQFNSMPGDDYSIKLTNVSGEVLLTKNIKHEGGNNEYYLTVNSVIKGIYTITVSGKNSGKIIHLPIIVN